MEVWNVTLTDSAQRRVGLWLGDGAAPGGHRLALLSPGPGAGLHPFRRKPGLRRGFPSSQITLLWASDVFHWRKCAIFLNGESTMSQAREHSQHCRQALCPLGAHRPAWRCRRTKWKKNIQWGAGEPVVETPYGAWTQTWGLQTHCFLWDKCPSSPQIPTQTFVLQDSARVLLSMAAVSDHFLLYT